MRPLTITILGLALLWVFTLAAPALSQGGAVPFTVAHRDELKRNTSAIESLKVNVNGAVQKVNQIEQAATAATNEARQATAAANRATEAAQQAEQYLASYIARHGDPTPRSWLGATTWWLREVIVPIAIVGLCIAGIYWFITRARSDDGYERDSVREKVRRVMDRRGDQSSTREVDEEFDDTATANTLRRLVRDHLEPIQEKLDQLAADIPTQENLRESQRELAENQETLLRAIELRLTERLIEVSNLLNIQADRLEQLVAENDRGEIRALIQQAVDSIGQSQQAMAAALSAFAERDRA